MTSLYSASTLFSKVGDFYSQHIAPKLTKENIYDATAGSVSMAAYYYLGSSVGPINGPMFVKRASLSMGFTVFNTAIKPVVAQFVESFVEMQVNNVEYTYYSIRCITDVKYCDEITKITNTAISSSETEGLVQFDTTMLMQKLSQDFSELTLDKLLLSGAVSAVASEVKNAAYVVTGFDQICQGSICKNWISYYVRDALKNEIKSVISDPIETDNTAQSIAPIAIALPELSKIDIKEIPQEIFLTGTLNANDMSSSIQIHEVIDIPSAICPIVNHNMSEVALQQQGIDDTAVAAWVQQFNTMNVLPPMMLVENLEP